MYCVFLEPIEKLLLLHTIHFYYRAISGEVLPIRPKYDKKGKRKFPVKL